MRLAMRKGSTAQAKLSMVKSRRRTKTKRRTRVWAEGLSIIWACMFTGATWGARLRAPSLQHHSFPGAPQGRSGAARHVVNGLWHQSSTSAASAGQSLRLLFEPGGFSVGHEAPDRVSAPDGKEGAFPP